MNGWRAYAQQVLAQAGYRRGGVREAVLGALERERCAVSVAELERKLLARGAPGSRASLYRILEQLEVLGLVVKVETGGASARYETRREGADHHHHHVCERCGALNPFIDRDLEEAIAALCKRLPLVVTAHEIQLRGRCARCAN